MHPNLEKGNQIHREHFEAIKRNGWTAAGWEVYCANKALRPTRLRPDWVLVNKSEKLAIIVDLTTAI